MQTILVIDDTPICREPILAALAHEGYRVVGAGDGKTGLAAVRAEVPDLVLLDLQMPDLDGWSVLRAMRIIPQAQQTPVILLTATADQACVLRAKEFGVRGYVLKSQFSLPELLTRIRKILDPPPLIVANSGTAPPEPPLEKPARTTSDVTD